MCNGARQIMRIDLFIIQPVIHSFKSIQIEVFDCMNECVSHHFFTFVEICFVRWTKLVLIGSMN